MARIWDHQHLLGEEGSHHAPLGGKDRAGPQDCEGRFLGSYRRGHEGTRTGWDTGRIEEQKVNVVRSCVHRHIGHSEPIEHPEPVLYSLDDALDLAVVSIDDSGMRLLHRYTISSISRTQLSIMRQPECSGSAENC